MPAYVYGGHGPFIASAITAVGNTSITQAKVQALPQIRRLANLLGQTTTAHRANVAGILAQAQNQADLLNVAYQAAVAAIAQVNTNIPNIVQDVGPSPVESEQPAPVSEQTPPEQPTGEVHGGKQPEETQAEDHGVMEDALYPSGPPAEETFRANEEAKAEGSKEPGHGISYESGEPHQYEESPQQRKKKGKL